jgi:PAS domain S-box-containing protein
MIVTLVVTAESAFAADCERHLGESDRREIVTVSTVSEAVDTLEDRSIDCIISDHDLPDTDGLAFLQIVRANNPTLPFILFTSEGSEAVASRAISADVTEYLIKERQSKQWDRLGSLVDDAVAYARSHEEIVTTERRAKVLLDAAHDMVAVVRDDTVAYVNQTGLEFLEVETTAAVTGRSLGDLLVKGGDRPLTETIRAVQEGDRTLERVEANLITDNDTITPVEITASRIDWPDEPAAILVIRDISERKAYKSDLELKNRVMDKAPVGITIADADQQDNPLIYVNDAFEQLTGYAAEDALGRNCRFLQGPETDPDAVAAMREAIAADEPVTVELRNYRQDGTEFWNRVTVAPIRDDTGAVTHYVGFQSDVTDRKEAQQMLRRFREGIEAAGHAVYMTDPDGTIEYVNPAFERITGYSADDAIGRNPRILKSGEMSDSYYERLWKTLQAGEVWDEEIVNRRADGERYYAHQTIAPVTEDGSIDGFVAIQTDITEQKDRETQLQHYERAIDGTNEMIAALDDDYQYLFANPAYREFHDIQVEEVTDCSLSDVLDDDTYEEIIPYVDEALSGDTVQYRMTRTRTDKPDRIFKVRYYPLQGKAGEIKGGVGTFQDITQQVERENQLLSLDRMLRHTLRNELNVILSRAELISNDKSKDVERDAAAIIDVANIILTQAEKEREIVELLTNPQPPKRQNLTDVVDRVVDRMERDNPSATITVDMPADVPLRAIPEIERAIEEVLENAISHSDNPSPSVSVAVTVTEESVTIRVEDDGPGIPEQERHVIAQDSKAAPLVHSGGMGLWLVKRIINRADGTIRFGDAPGNGGVVELVIPRDSSE